MGEVHASSIHQGFPADRASAEPSRKRLTKAVVGVTLGNMVEWFEMSAFDLLGEMAFGESFGCVAEGEFPLSSPAVPFQFGCQQVAD